jgi:hypothetical protein
MNELMAVGGGMILAHVQCGTRAHWHLTAGRDELILAHLVKHHDPHSFITAVNTQMNTMVVNMDK